MQTLQRPYLHIKSNGFDSKLLIYRNEMGIDEEKLEIDPRISDLSDQDHLSVLDRNGNTMLIKAINDHKDKIALELIAKIDSKRIFEQKDKQKIPVLYYAINDGKDELSMAIIEKGADVNIVDEYGFNSLVYAIHRESQDVVINRESQDVVINLLLDKGVDYKHKFKWDGLDYDMIDLAVSVNYLHPIAKILEKDPKFVENKFRSKHDQSLIEEVFLKRENLDSAKFLLNYIDDVNLKNKEGKTLLHYLAKIKKINNQFVCDLAEYLLGKGADCNIKSNSQETALEYAIKNENFDLTKLLLERGAKLTGQAFKNIFESKSEELINFFQAEFKNFKIELFDDIDDSLTDVYLKNSTVGILYYREKYLNLAIKLIEKNPREAKKIDPKEIILNCNDSSPERGKDRHKLFKEFYDRALGNYLGGKTDTEALEYKQKVFFYYA